MEQRVPLVVNARVRHRSKPTAPPYSKHYPGDVSDNAKHNINLAIAIIALLMGGAALIWNITQATALSNVNTINNNQQMQIDMLEMEQMQTDLTLQELILNMSSTLQEEVVQTGTAELCGDACLEPEPPEKRKKSPHKRQYNGILVDYTLSKVSFSGTEIFYLDLDVQQANWGNGLEITGAVNNPQAHVVFAFQPALPLTIPVPDGGISQIYRKVLLSKQEKDKFTLIWNENEETEFGRDQLETNTYDVGMANTFEAIENSVSGVEPWPFQGRYDEGLDDDVEDSNFAMSIHVVRHPSTVEINGPFRVQFPFGTRQPAPPLPSKKK